MEPLDEYHCSMCNVKCNSTVTLEQHYKSAGHQRRQRESRRALSTTAQDGNTTPPASGDESANAEPPGNGATGFAIAEEELDYCSLCDMTFTHHIMARQHYQGAKHLQKKGVSKPPQEVKIYGDCKICNKIFAGQVQAEAHFSSKKHLDRVEKSNKAAVQHENLGEMEYCSICDIMFNHPTQARQHYEGAKHLQKKLKLEQPPEVHGECKLCNKIFAGQLQADAHFASRKHQEKVEASTKPPVPQENFGECAMCNKVFPFETQAKAHYESKKHLEKLKAMENPPEKKEPFGECTLCAKVFPFEGQAKAHYESKKHLQKVRARDIEEGKVTDDAPVSEVDGSLYGTCDLCQKKFPSEIQATSHYASRKHIQKAELAKLRLSDKDSAAKKDEGDAESPEIKAESEPDLKSMDFPAIEKYVYLNMNCPFCKKTFSGYQPVKDHLSSRKHVTRVTMVKLSPELSTSGSPTPGTTNALGSVCEDISVDECGPSEEQMVFGEILDECILNDIVNALLTEINQDKRTSTPNEPSKEAVATSNNDQGTKTRKRSMPASEEPPVVPVRQSKRRNCK